MKKLLCLSFVLLFLVCVSNAQSNYKSNTLLNLGVGFSGWGVPVYGGLDFKMNRDITLGGEISYSSYDENWDGNTYHHSITGIAMNLNYYFNNILSIPKDFDFYTGLNLGFYIWSNPENYPGNHSSGLGLGAQIGGRYYFNNKIGLNLELVTGIANLGGKIGVTFKI